MSSGRKSHFVLALGGVAIALLLAAVFTLGSLTLPFRPNTVVLFALSTFIAAALIIFASILVRTLLKLGAERRARQPGSRFKAKMVLGAIAVSFLPVIFLFFYSYALLNHTLVMWFPQPLEDANRSSRALINEMNQTDYVRMNEIAQAVAKNGIGPTVGDMVHSFDRAFEQGADLAWIVNAQGKPTGVGINPDIIGAPGAVDTSGELPVLAEKLLGGAELWRYHGSYFVAGRAQAGNNYFLAGNSVPDDFLDRVKAIDAQTLGYDAQKQQLRTYKTQLIATLFLFTILLMFATTWIAIFLSKQVTVPIQALAEATQEVAAGNFDARVDVQAQDELASLVGSFNRMTEQLSDSRRQIDEFTRSLQQAVQELERRRTLMETILENIPTGVISLDEQEMIARVNPAAVRMFGDSVRHAETLVQFLGERSARDIQVLMRRALRMGTASKELEFTIAGRLLHAAVTVTSLGPRRANRGYVVVVDDLTDLLGAQKSAAWQEVAQRIAHEIKNPLTPIQLSAQRLSRYLDRHGKTAERQDSPELVRLVGECSGLIEREVATLESLVGEFSQFARFPTAKLSPADPNAIVNEALAVFEGRLEGIRVRKDFAPDLPSIRADEELLRRVIVNLIDNAAEAMESSPARELFLRTRYHAHRDTVEIVVADNGHGISPEDKDKLFLPHFSTKDRGTGLGLAIASRIIAEHNGSIRVEDNSPIGARFILQLPVSEAVTSATSPSVAPRSA